MHSIIEGEHILEESDSLNLQSENLIFLLPYSFFTIPRKPQDKNNTISADQNGSKFWYY